ncbi:hypothetical protein pb186bvf_005894 [Paramecium bursaria]
MEQDQEALRILEQVMIDNCMGMAKVTRKKIIQCKNLYIGVQITKVLWEKIRIWIVYKEYKPYPLSLLQRYLLAKIQFDRVQKICELDQNQERVEIEWNQIDNKKLIYDNQEHPLAAFRDQLDQYSDKNIFKLEHSINQNCILKIDREHIFINNYLTNNKIQNNNNPKDILEAIQLCSINIKIQQLIFTINQIYIYEIKGQNNTKINQILYHIKLENTSIILDLNETLYLLHKLQKNDCFLQQFDKFIEQTNYSGIKQIEITFPYQQYTISCLEFKIHNYKLRIIKSINENLTNIIYKLFIKKEDQYILIAQGSKLRKLKTSLNHIIHNQIYYSMDTATILEHFIIKVKQNNNFLLSDQITILSNKKLTQNKVCDAEIIIILSQELMIPLFGTQDDNQNILSKFLLNHQKYYDYRLMYQQFIDDQLIQKLYQKFQTQEHQGINLESLIEIMFNLDEGKQTRQLVQQHILKDTEYNTFRNIILQNEKQLMR